MAKQTEAAKQHGMNKPTPAGAGNAGEKTHDLRPLDEGRLNDPELVSSVEDRLSALREITGPYRSRKNPAAEDEDLDELEGQEDDADELEEKTAGKDQPEGSDSSTLDNDAGGEEDIGEGKQTHVLPEAYVRCAVAYGWTEDDVKAFFESDPERALTTLSSIYQTRNRASAQFAAIGRKHAEAKDEPQNVKPTFQPVDVAKLKEHYGDDAAPLIDMIEAQNRTLQQLSDQLPKEAPKARKPFESAVEESGVEQQIYTFFETDKMKSYEKVYGKLEFGQTWDDLTPGQRQHRWRVLEQADQIAGGAKLQGYEMSLAEALESAHLLVTQKYRDQVLIDGLKASVVKRAKGMTLKPSKGTRKPGDRDDPKPGERTREQLLEATQHKLNRMFGG